MTAQWSDWRSRPEVIQWYERLIRRCLSTYRESPENPAWFRQALGDPDVFEWVLWWYMDRQDRFAVEADPLRVWLSDLSDVDGPDQRIMFDEKAVSTTVFGVVENAGRAMAGIREARSHLTLDRWLEALHAGKLEWDGPSERVGYELVADLGTFIDAARNRQQTWPRLCRTCSTEFTPDRANVKNCIDCRAKRRSGAKHGNATG